MEITVNQIEKVLDQTLEELLSGKVKNKNVIFMGETGIGKTSVVEDWFKKNKDKIHSFEMDAAPFCEEKNGRLVKIVKDGKYVYGFDDKSVEKLNEDGTVLFCDDFSHRSSELIKPFESIIKNRNYTTPIFNNFYNLDKLGLVIITMLPDNSKDYYVSDISYLYESCDVYNVKVDVKEFKEFFIKEKTKRLKDDEANKKVLEFFDKILSSTSFQFIYDDNECFSPRELDRLYYDVIDCDNNESIKESIMSEIKNRGNKTQEMFKKILEEIKD